MNPEPQPPQSPADIPADEADFDGSDPAHLVALPLPPTGPPKEIVVPATRIPRPEDQLPGAPPGSTPDERSAAAKELIDSITPLAMREANIFSLCYEAAKDVVSHHQADEMRDAVSIGESIFAPGSRTPLEASVPQIAIEIYRNVRQEMRDRKKPAGRSKK